MRQTQPGSDVSLLTEAAGHVGTTLGWKKHRGAVPGTLAEQPGRTEMSSSAALVRSLHLSKRRISYLTSENTAHFLTLQACGSTQYTAVVVVSRGYASFCFSVIRVVLTFL